MEQNRGPGRCCRQPAHRPCQQRPPSHGCSPKVDIVYSPVHSPVKIVYSPVHSPVKQSVVMAATRKVCMGYGQRSTTACCPIGNQSLQCHFILCEWTCTPWTLDLTRYQDFVQSTVSHTLLQGHVYHNLTARFAAALHAVQMAVFGYTAQALQHNSVKNMHKHVKALGLAQVHQHTVTLPA